MASPIFGLEARALQLSEYRAALISRNIANSSTPGYKSRDFDFSSAMKAVRSNDALNTTHARHLSVNSSSSSEVKLAYRVPMQSSPDDNTVDDEIERKNFIANSIKYQASISFVQSKLGTLMHAIKGE